MTGCRAPVCAASRPGAATHPSPSTPLVKLPPTSVRHPASLVLLVLAVLLAALTPAAGATTRRGHPAGRPRAATAPHWARVIQTTSDLANALTVMPAQRFTSEPVPGALVIRVNPGVRYQTMLGFGAAMTDSSAWLLQDALSPQTRAQTMRALFSPAGIGLDFVRIPMGATDYTTGAPYTYDDVPAGQADPKLNWFSIAHDQPYVLPALRAMLAVNPAVYTLASPWTAPPWMKANDTFNDANLAGDVIPADYPAFARYFADFLSAYRAAGVPVDAITPMNEPNSDSGWPGTHLTPADDATFIPQDLVPALAAAGQHPVIYGNDDTRLTDAQALLGGPAGGDVGGVAFHCYAGLSQLSTLHAEYPSRPLIVSECSPGIIPYATADVPIAAARNWAVGTQLWNLALDPSGGPYEGDRSWGCPGCTGVVTVDESTHQTAYGLNYYQYGQTTRYVARGAVRIASSRAVTGLPGGGITAGIDNVAFVNPNGGKVLVAYNNGSLARTISVRYLGRYVSWWLPAGATVTLLWK